jgi:hypothetical protein
VTYTVLQDAVSGGFLVVETNGTTGEQLVVAKCPNETRANQIVNALSA